jgi:hypothetical protein
LKSIEELLRKTPPAQVAPVEANRPAASPVETVPDTVPAWAQPVTTPAAARGSAWASKEELEKLAERAARIRERHESRRSAEESTEEEPSLMAPVAQMPSATRFEVETLSEQFEAVEPAEPAAEVSCEPAAEVSIEPALAEAGEPPSEEEAPPPLEEVLDAAASVEAEAMPVSAPVAEEFVAEPVAEAASVEEPAPAEAEKQPEMQPLAQMEIPSFDAPQMSYPATSEGSLAIAPGPDLLMKPMGTASLIPDAPEEPLDQTAELSPVDVEPEFFRVRVSPQEPPATEDGADKALLAPAAPEASEITKAAELNTGSDIGSRTIRWFSTVRPAARFAPGRNSRADQIQSPVPGACFDRHQRL